MMNGAFVSPLTEGQRKMEKGCEEAESETIFLKRFHLFQTRPMTPLNVWKKKKNLCDCYGYEKDKG